MNNLVFEGKKAKVIVLDGRKHFTTTFSKEKDVCFHGVIYGETISFERYFLKHEKEDFADVFGKFVIIIHDKKLNTLTIHNDRYGMVPFYEYNSMNNTYYSFSIFDLLRSKIVENNINYSSLSDILAFSIPLGNKTLIEKITSCAPATKTIICLDTGIRKDENTWDIVQILKMKKLDFDPQKNELLARFIEGCKKCLIDKTNIGITLSGGIDSRCLLSTGLFLGAREKIHTYNVGIPGSRAHKYSKSMSEICNVDYTFKGPDNNFMSEYYSLLNDIIERTEGMTFSSEVEGTWLRNQIDVHEQVVLHGAFGELSKIASMHQFGLSKELLNCGRDEFAERLWKRFESEFNLIKNVFSDEIKHKIEGLSKKNLKEIVARIDPSLSNEDVLIYLYIKEFLQKVTKYSSHIWEHKIPVAFVFSYPKFVDLILQIRNEEKTVCKFQKYLLKNTKKELYEFPDSNTGTKIGSSIFYNEVVHKFTRLVDILFNRKTSYDHYDYVYWVKNMAPLPEKILQSKLFNKNMIIEIISKAKEGELFPAIAVQKLILFKIWNSRINCLTSKE